MIIALALIGTTGLAMADSTTQTYVGDGSYSTNWNGNSGTMSIDTYTSYGADHINVDYRRGYTSGEQTGMTENGWTEIDRGVYAIGDGVAINTATVDNSGDLVAIGTSGTYITLNQEAYMTDEAFGYDVEGVVSDHRVMAIGREAGVSVYTEAGEAYTVVELTSNRFGFLRINGIAVAGNGYGYNATGQSFEASAWLSGETYIIGSGEYVGIDMDVRNDNTQYSATANGMVYIELYDQYNRGYNANGYIYAVDLPATPV